MEKRRGYSDVISSLILTAVVITVGLSVWGYAASASSVMSTDYFEEVMVSVQNIQERFYVEGIGLDIISSPSIQIWVTNYGNVQVNITRIMISGGGNIIYYYPPDNIQHTPPNGCLIAAGEMVRFDIDPGTVPVTSDSSISIMVESEMENKVYAKERIP